MYYYNFINITKNKQFCNYNNIRMSINKKFSGAFSMGS